MGRGGKAMSYEQWRMSRTELRELLGKYEKAVEDDASALLKPSAAERRLLGLDVLKRRAEAVRRARDANRRFVEAVVEDLPDWCMGPDVDLNPPRPVATFRNPPEGVPALPSGSYGSIASVLLHLFRDWSANCEHVLASTYNPAVRELKKLLPNGGEVLLPGAGLGRLALGLATEGYRVEANDASRLFLTVADYLLNRAPSPGMPVYPLAHVFSENWGHGQQYAEICVPCLNPASVLGSRPPITLVPGEFVPGYRFGGPNHRQFDALVTCFFIDTAADIAELFQVMDGLLAEGGVWVNVGPLNWRKEARLKLCWDEVVEIWEGLGYDFLTQERVDCDYHMPRGLKMYTESYHCALTAAVKRRAT